MSDSRRPEPANTSPVLPQGGAGLFLRPVADVAADLVSGLRETVKRQRLPIEQAWVDFLAPYEWQWFATFTFKEATHPEAADKRYRFWTRLLDDAHGVEARKPKSHKRRSVWVRGLEWQKRDVLHFHALIGNLPPLENSAAQRAAWADAWWLMGNTGFAKIHPVSFVGGVTGYVTKYCAKGGEIDVSANLGVAVPDLAGTVPAA